MGFLLILGAYLLSALVAALVIMAATLPSVASVGNAIAHILGGALFVAPLIALFAAPPSLAVIALPNDTIEAPRSFMHQWAWPSQ